MEDALKKQAVSGLGWYFLQRFGTQAVTFLLSVILARLLDPAAYGTVAIVTVFTNLFTLLIDCGMGTVLIQKIDADNYDYSTLFYFNLIASGCAYWLLFGCAPVIGNYYNRPELATIIRVLSLSLPLAGAYNVQSIFLQKTLLFKTIFKLALLYSIVSTIIGISMAFGGYGVWSLVGMMLGGQCVRNTAAWWLCPWRPACLFSFQRLKEIFRQGAKLMAVQIVNYSYGDICQLIMGKMFTPTNLAYYNKSSNLPKLLLDNTLYTIDGVMFPVMCKVNDHPEQVRHFMQETTLKSSLLVWPMLIFLAMLSDEITLLLYGAKWFPTAFFMKIYCLGYFLHTINCSNLDALKALKQNGLLLKLEILKKILCFSVLFFSCRYGVVSMAVGIATGNLLASVINSYPNHRLLGYGFLKQMRELAPLLLICGGLTALLLLPRFTVPSLLCRVPLMLLLGGSFYLVAIHLCYRKHLDDFRQMLLPRFQKRTAN